MHKTKTFTESNSDISYTVELVDFDDNRHRVYLSKNLTIGCEGTNIGTLIDWAAKI